jgi:autotransporter passenger strand-loop-strand repeat protein
VGTAINTTVNSNGEQDVLKGGVASGTTISSGGVEIIQAGGAVDGATIHGGELVVSSGGIAGNQTVDFDGGGTLKLDASQSYGMLVAGFNTPSDVIDFSTINFVTASKSFVEAPNNLSGTLTVTDGTHAASVLLMGNYMASNFALSQESGGTGTLVVDPPPATTPHLVGPTVPVHV